MVRRIQEKEQDSLSIENVLVSMAKMTGMVRRIQEKTWEKMSYLQDMNATTRHMLTFIPGVPNLPVMMGAGASPREHVINSSQAGRTMTGSMGGMGGMGGPMGGMGGPGPGMGGPMGPGAPMGAPAMPGPQMNVQPGMGGNVPFGNTPNTTMTTMNSSTMSTTAP